MGSSQPNKQEVANIFSILKAYNFKDTERILKKELESAINKNRNQKNQIEQKIDYQSYFKQYLKFNRAVDTSLDGIRYGLGLIKFFVYIFYYLKIIRQNAQTGNQYLKKFAPSHDFYLQSAIEAYISNPSFDCLKLDSVKDRVTIFCNEKCQNWLKEYFEEGNCDYIEDIIDSNITLRECPKDQSDFLLNVYYPRDFAKSINSVLNNSQILLGIPDETFFTSLQNEISFPSTYQPESPAEEKRRGRKKLTKKDNAHKVTLPNDCPDWSRIPLPNILEAPMLRAIKLLGIEKSSQAPTLGKDIQPSVCGYTLFNTSNNCLPCAKFSENCQLLATGFDNSIITVWNMSNQENSGLKTMKHKLDPQAIDFSSNIEQIEANIYEDTKSFTKNLVGHSNTVCSLDFYYDNSLLVSSSYDENIRLWSLNTWNTISVYKGHLSPVWDVSFAPFGHYFASCGSDRTSRLWSIEQSKPLRLFCGHSTDVARIQFHPNSNYILTGSDDCTIFLWDVLTGNYERCFIGHNSPISALSVSPDGKKCASGDTSGLVIIWDMYSATPLGKINLGHQSRSKKSDEYISTIEFGKDSISVAIGTLKSKLVVGSIANLDFRNMNSNADLFETIGVYRTKNTPITDLHFTYNNMLLSIGAYSL